MVGEIIPGMVGDIERNRQHRSLSKEFVSKIVSLAQENIESASGANRSRCRVDVADDIPRRRNLGHRADLENVILPVDHNKYGRRDSS